MVHFSLLPNTERDTCESMSFLHSKIDQMRGWLCVLLQVKEGEEREIPVLCFTNGLISDTDKLTEITPVTSLLPPLSPVCRPPANWGLFIWQIATSDTLRSPNICEPSIKLTSGWEERQTVCRRVWSMQSESPPCRLRRFLSRKHRDVHVSVWVCVGIIRPPANGGLQPAVSQGAAEDCFTCQVFI